jgi:hypothetical protein
MGYYNDLSFTIEQTVATLRNAGFRVSISDMLIVVSLNRAITTMEVKLVLDEAGIEARYHRTGGSVAVRL